MHTTYNIIILKLAKNIFPDRQLVHDYFESGFRVINVDFILVFSVIGQQEIATAGFCQSFRVSITRLLQKYDDFNSSGSGCSPEKITFLATRKLHFLKE